LEARVAGDAGERGRGKVVAVGDRVTTVKVGDRVILPFTVNKWQQRVLVRAEDLVVAGHDVGDRPVGLR
jgi:NADPH:quinone reductase-like Zn-dependent oxidoreductase